MAFNVRLALTMAFVQPALKDIDFNSESMHLCVCLCVVFFLNIVKAKSKLTMKAMMYFRATVVERGDMWFRDDGALTRVFCEDSEFTHLIRCVLSDIIRPAAVHVIHRITAAVTYF